MTTLSTGPASAAHRRQTLRAHRDGMRWRRAVACIVPALCLTACHDAAAPRAGAASMRPYPGFERVAQDGEAAAWRFDPTHIAQADQQYTIHVIRTLASASSASSATPATLATPDYVAFDVVTDCRQGARRLAGTRYRDDGIAGALYPGDTAPQRVDGASAIGQLLARACPLATASVSSAAVPAARPAVTVAPASGAAPGLIRGPFSSPAALELLYGKYDVNTESAAWLTPAIPATLAARDTLQYTPGDPLIVRSVAAIDFTEGGHAKKLFVTSGMPVSGGCDACTGLLGLAVFVQTDAGWQVESNAPYVASLGTEGAIGKRVAWTGSDTQGFVLVIEENPSATPGSAAPRVAFARRDGRFVRVAADATGMTATGVPTDAAPDTTHATNAAAGAAFAGNALAPRDGAASTSPASGMPTAASTASPPLAATTASPSLAAAMAPAAAAAGALGIATVATRHHAASPRKPIRRDHVDPALRPHAGPHREPAAARPHDAKADRRAEKPPHADAPGRPSPRHVSHGAVKP
ncbi:MAG: hypothetical protein ACRYGL_12150 [Janthinobacterium lividum]